MVEQKDLFQAVNETGKNKHIYTVSEITSDIKLILENTFPQVWVEGEISNYRPHPSGIFFSLKDEKALINAVMFGRSAKDLKFKVEDGQKVICFGRVEVYAPYGKYQLVLEKIEPKGIGGLQLALEQLKEKLEKEGLFSPAHKRPIPYLPGRIGIVTSPTGAAIKDMLKVLDSRFKDVQIIINPVRVQGDEAKEEIAAAIQEFNLYNEKLPVAERIEVMIVGRGGGSIEDLWAFNEEIVARAIYNSKIPVISAVGHERDWTVADLVADLRAPTPSVAAESVIPKKEDLSRKVENLITDLKRSVLDIAVSIEENISELRHRLGLSVAHAWEIDFNRLDSTVKKLNLLNPQALIQQYNSKVLDLARQIYVRLAHRLQLKEAVFQKAAEKLSNLSPLNILSRGYSITFKISDNAIIKDAQEVKAGDTIKTHLHKGEIISNVIETKNIH